MTSTNSTRDDRVRPHEDAEDSRTDWARLQAMNDSEVDMTDCPEMTPAEFARGIIRKGLKPPALSWEKRDRGGAVNSLSTLIAPEDSAPTLRLRLFQAQYTRCGMLLSFTKRKHHTEGIMTRLRLVLIFPLLAIGLFAGEKDGRWIDINAPTIPADVRYQGEYTGAFDAGDTLGCQVVALGKGIFQAVLYPGGLPGAGWDGTNRSILDGKLDAQTVTFTAASGERKHVAATRGREKNPSSTKVSLVTKFPPVGHVPSTATVTGATMTGSSAGKAFKLTKTIRQSPTLGQKPPQGAIVLFDGSNMDEWTGGSVNKTYKTLMPLPRDLMSKRTFHDYSIHLELMIPYQPEYRSQDRGNSGFYHVHDYEIQVLDSFAMDGNHNECGGIYSHKGPDVNMCLPPLAWQTFDVDFTNAVVENGKKVKDAIITVRHNGVLIHDRFKIPHKSKYGVRGGPMGRPGPIKLQNHREPLQYRNIWIVPKGDPPPPPPTATAATSITQPQPVAPTGEEAKALLGKWHIRFAGNHSEYVLNLYAHGTSNLTRKGKAWDGVWSVKDGTLTVTNPHDVIEIKLNEKDGVYSGKNTFGKARISRDELRVF